MDFKSIDATFYRSEKVTKSAGRPVTPNPLQQSILAYGFTKAAVRQGSNRRAASKRHSFFTGGIK